MSMNTITPPGIANTGQVGTESIARDRNLSISDIILQLGLTAMKLSEDKMNEFYDKVNKANIELANINEAKRLLNEGKSIDDMMQVTNDDGTKTKMSIKDFITNKIGGIDEISGKEKALSRLTQRGEELGSVNSMDMTKLQSAINKMNEMTQLVTNNLSKFNSMNMAIIGNLR